MIPSLDTKPENTYYYLNNQNIVVKCTQLEFCNWTILNKKILFQNNKEYIEVSTVFIGKNPNHTPSGDPLVFETIIFGGKHDNYEYHSSTYIEAVKNHITAKKLAGFYDKHKPIPLNTHYRYDNKPIILTTNLTKINHYLKNHS